jgi:hypothetical protein
LFTSSTIRRPTMQSEYRARSADVECREDALANVRDAIASI